MSDLPTIPVTEAPSNDVPVLDRARLMGTIRVLRDLKDRAPIVSIAYLDLDRFHQVNTRWGHRLGDQLLSVVERRLRGAVPLGAMLARLDGDGFVVLVPGMGGEDIRVLAEVLLRLIATPVSLDGRVVAVRASAGVVTRSAPIGEDLVEEAFMACRQAKSTNVGMVEESVLAAMVARRGQIEAELARGIENSELRLRFQPKVDLRDGTVVGVEALVRWQHPELGLVGPGAFIDIAEESGLIVPLGAWVLQAAIEQARRWPATISGAPLRTWVNLSAAQLGHIAELRTILRDAIAGGLDPRAIGFEVTESSLLADLPGAVDVLESLRSLGAELALDDFGTGYSSLTYLRQLPVSTVKIDRSFVTGMDGSLADAAIVEAVVELSHALGLEVVAEGVEEAHQVDELLRLGVDRAQGYWFAEPLPAYEMAALVAQPWCGKPAPAAARERDHRADGLPGFGGPRSRLLLAALDASADSVMVSSVGDLVAGVAPHIDYVNPAFEADTGYRTEQVLGRSVWFNYPEDLEGALARDALMSALQARVSSTLVVPSVRADGERRQCELTVTPIMDERGMLSHWLHVRRDLTSRHALEADRDRFRRVIEQTAVGVVLTEIDGSVTYANQAARDLVSFPADRSLDGTDLMSLIPADEIDEHHARVFPLLRRDGEFAGPVTATAFDGQRIPLWVDIRIVQDPRHPRGAYLAAVAQDRRPELAVAEALAASSRRAQELLSGTADAVVLLDPAGRITYANRALETLLGAPIQQLIGSSAFSWISPTHREEMLQSFIDQLAEDSDGGEELEIVFKVVHVDGTEIPVEAAVVRRFHDPTINGLVMSLRDMRRRLASERRDHQQTIFDRLLAAVAQSALDRGPEGFFATLDDHLIELAEALDVDRIFVNEIGATHVTTLATVDTIDLPRTDPTVPRGQLTSWIEMLERHDRVLIDDLVVDPHDAIAREAEVYEAVPRALAAVALRSEGRLTAAIGALQVARPRRWERQEIDVLARCGATIVHVLEQRRLDRALRESQSRLQALVDHAGDGLIVVDQSGRIRFVSSVFADLLAMECSQLVGRLFTEIIHHDDLSSAVHSLTRAVSGVLDDEVTLRLVSATGEARWWELTTTGPAPDALDGAVVFSGRDVTDRRHAEEAAARRLEHLSMTFAVTQLALDVGAEEFLDRLSDVSSDLGRLIGADAVVIDVIVEGHDGERGGNVHGDLGGSDAPDGGKVPIVRVGRWRAQGCDVQLEESWTEELAHLRPVQLTRADGRRVLAVPMVAAGEVLGSLTVIDRREDAWPEDELALVRLLAETVASVLQRRRLDSALKASESRYRLLSEHAADVVGLVRLDGFMTYVSPSVTEVLGYAVEDVIGRNVTDFVIEEDLVHVQMAVREVLGGQTLTYEVRIRRADGSVVWTAHTTRVVLDDDGAPVGLRFSIRDITERKHLEAELKRQALHDPLTGLANRALLQSRLQVAASRRGSPNELALMLIDLDGFKEVNDRFGHGAGDAVLLTVAQRLEGLTRGGDTLARMGGDEFVLLCPETTLEGAAAVAERVVAVVSEPIDVSGAMHVLGASVGISHQAGPVADPERMLQEADRAMYEAKKSGKGRVCLAATHTPTLS